MLENNAAKSILRIRCEGVPLAVHHDILGRLDIRGGTCGTDRR